ncbi:SlyX family protein [Salipiger bermudensis]|uniref:SlyX family protein n=1 Tax=Salipiger bermudensis TaxID=344736 RepID=UPI001C990C67|nr:SlyX family protein [Salipiger bermudensis]MBY6003549.1 SlyX family protein [Salipiger bermudensis]
MPSDTDSLQERIAHLDRAVDDLSETVARQDREIALLTRRVALLLEREAARQDEGTGGVVMGDERPPHY